MSSKDILVKYLVLNSNSEDTCVVLLQLIRLAVFGMLEQESACLCYEDTLIKSLISTSMPLEPA